MPEIVKNIAISSATVVFLSVVKIRGSLNVLTANLFTKIDIPEIRAAVSAKDNPLDLFIDKESYSGQTCCPVSVSVTIIAFVGHDCAAMMIESPESELPSCMMALFSLSS